MARRRCWRERHLRYGLAGSACGGPALMSARATAPVAAACRMPALRCLGLSYAYHTYRLTLNYADATVATLVTTDARSARAAGFPRAFDVAQAGRRYWNVFLTKTAPHHVYTHHSPAKQTQSLR